MSFFKTYRNFVSCSKTDKDYQDCLITEDIKKDFKVSPSYQRIYKNLEYVALYDTQIDDNSKFKDTIGDKSFLSYPYDEVKFEIGDYISWVDASKELTHWVLVALDTQHLYRIKGEVTKCNNIFRFSDDMGNIYEYPCVIEEKLVMSGLSNDKQMNIPEGRFQVTLQLNDDTRKIKEDTRVLFNNLGNQDSEYGIQATKVTNFVNITEKCFLKLYMIKDQINEYVDDIENLIANRYINNYILKIEQDGFSQSIGHSETLSYTITNNGNVAYDSKITWSSSNEDIGIIDQSGNIELLAIGQVIFTATYDSVNSVSDSIVVNVVSVPAELHEIRIEPNISEILLGETQQYTAYKYIDNILQSDVFTITADDTPSQYYDLNILDGNTFMIKNNKMYQNETLDVTCVSNTDATFEIINIKLKGAW